MQERTYPPFKAQKRDEMTFGYLPEFVLPDLVPDLRGSAQVYPPCEVHALMTQMDGGLVGMRRSLIDRLETVRQLILYVLVVKFVDNEMRVAVYQRAAGAEARLKDGYSIGFGGHVELDDVAPHLTTNEQGEQIPTAVPSSYFSTLFSGMRELDEEVNFFLPSGGELHMRSEVVPCGFVSDYRPDEPGFVGTTHLGVLALLRVDEAVDFKVVEDKYTTIGWMTTGELIENAGRFEEWSKFCLTVLTPLEEMARTECGEVIVSDRAPTTEELNAALKPTCALDAEGNTAVPAPDLAQLDAAITANFDTTTK